MIKTPVKQAIKSKGIIAGIFMMILGAYVIVEQKDTTGGLSIMGIGLGILGIRDAQQD
jgi:drug/metabolite transporter (DMT)-like permease